jgi:hypothetical protein
VVGVYAGPRQELRPGARAGHAPDRQVREVEAVGPCSTRQSVTADPSPPSGWWSSTTTTHPDVTVAASARAAASIGLTE